MTVERAAFQALHGAARAVFQQAIQTDNHSQQSLLYLQALDQAIDEGHRALGTERPAADKFMHLVRGLTEIQRQNAQTLLEREGLLTPHAEDPLTNTQQ